MASNKTNVGSFNLHEENLTLCHRCQTYNFLTNTETEFIGIKLIRHTINMALDLVSWRAQVYSSLSFCLQLYHYFHSICFFRLWVLWRRIFKLVMMKWHLLFYVNGWLWCKRGCRGLRPDPGRFLTNRPRVPWRQNLVFFHRWKLNAATSKMWFYSACRKVFSCFQMNKPDPIIIIVPKPVQPDGSVSKTK